MLAQRKIWAREIERGRNFTYVCTGCRMRLGLAVLLASCGVSSLELRPSPLRRAPLAACGARAALRAAPARLAADGDEPIAAAGKLVKDCVGKMKKSVSNVQESLSTLRVGRANPSLLDRVEVSYYDTPTPLNQLASVTAPTASQLVVDVYDKSAMGDVEKALFESDIGMTPSNDGKVIRLNVPQLTTERRAELAKTAKGLGEDGKVAIRNVRKGALTSIKKLKKDGLGEDQIKDKEDEVQKAVKKYEGEVADLVAQREKEIMEPNA